MARLSTRTIALALLVSVAHGFDPSKRSRCTDGKLCLDSFIWCSTESGNSGCSYPDGAMEMDVSQGYDNPTALLNTDSTYTIGWKNADDKHPVVLSWHITYYNKEEVKPEEKWIWSRNFTNGENSFTFNFFDLAKEAKPVDEDSEEKSNESPYRILGYTQDYYNTMVVSQPDMFQIGLSPAEETSHKFAVTSTPIQNTLSAMVIDNLKGTDTKKWKIGVGVGVGIGVPILMAAAFFAGNYLGKRSSIKSDENVKTTETQSVS